MTMRAQATWRSVLAVVLLSGPPKHAQVAGYLADRSCHGRERQWATCENLPSCTQACKPRDCIFAPWGDWYTLGGCVGLCARRRPVAENSNECGRPCTGSTFQTLQRSDCMAATCLPSQRDCSWGSWTDWSSCRGPGQSNRTRRISVEPLLDGDACVGPWKQTRPCTKAVQVDCSLSPWGEWTECSASCEGGFKAQMRHVVQKAEHGGRPCRGVTRRTEPCNVRPCDREVKPCILSKWEEWDGCDDKNPHQKYRRRSILEPSPPMAGLCSHVLLETDGCPKDWSSFADCHPLTGWTAWSECSDPCEGQRFRTRHLDLSATDPNCTLSKRGRVPMHEVVPCMSDECMLGTGLRLSQWTDWGQCQLGSSEGSCGIGSTTRSREVVHPGTPHQMFNTQALEMIKACDEGPCTPVDCKWGSWHEWGSCTRSCGGGERRRSRSVQEPPKNGGSECPPKARTEVAPCNEQDCEECLDGAWGEWGQWSSCTATCDHGFQMRHRDIMQYPNSCGTPASGLEDEYRPCRLMPCEVSQDCKLTSWGEWSDCTSTCIGIKERRRQIVSLAAGGGMACEDMSLKEIAPCTSASALAAQQAGQTCGESLPRPCLLAAWGSWSHCCTAAGKGMRRRTRNVLVPSENNGPSCEGALSEVGECEDGSYDDHCQDCRWSAWSPWGCCSLQGGQRYRLRSVVEMGNYCGKPCEAKVAKEVEPCPRPAVEVRYCAWSAWADMTAECTATCGTATKLRRRSLELLEEKPGPVVEWAGPGSCLDVEGHKYSQWRTSVHVEEECQMLLRVMARTAWVRGAEYDIAQKTCEVVVDTNSDPRGSTDPDLWVKGDNSRTSGLGSGLISSTDRTPDRTCYRMVSGTVLEGGKDLHCAGSQIDVVACGFVSCSLCTKRDCRFAPWGSWSDPSCSQLCERRRTVMLEGACGGMPCEGRLVETRLCPRDCSAEKQDCILSQWGEWHPFQCIRGVSQRTRLRFIEMEASTGGLPCEGPLREVRSCDHPAPEVLPCKVAPWSSWAPCSRDCGGGMRTRSRRIVSEAQGGAACENTLQELDLCNVHPCGSAPCQMSPWAPWSGCSADAVAMRHRKVLHGAASAEGPGCHGALREVRSCILSIDCLESPWTDWGPCDEECGGQQRRHRQVVRNPMFGGRPCARHLAETRGCTVAACSAADCEVNQWTEWGSCTVTCGTGHQSRHRDLVRQASPFGQGCTSTLAESRRCQGIHGPCPVDDCRWGFWSDWAGCSCSCGGGQRTRDRHIIQVPSPGGRPCDVKNKEEIQPCNTQPCGSSFCVDGEWGPWAEWEACSRTCDNGTTFRVRKVLREANQCGKPVVGFSVEQASCNTGTPCSVSLDCKLAPWTTWSACSRPCAGMAKRSRFVQTVPRGGGKACKGPLSEAKPCYDNCDPSLQPKDCELSPWGPWGTCDAACGQGQHSRERHIVEEGRLGGRKCFVATTETQSCYGPPCDTCTPIDCRWEAWEEWGACDKCDGQRKRFRHVEVQPSCHGRDCDPQASEEIGACTRRCHEKALCIWAPWLPWSDCSETCGANARRSRDRWLQLRQEVQASELGTPTMKKDELSDIEEKLYLLRVRAKGLEETPFTHLLTSFAFGSLSFIAGISIVQHFSSGPANQRPHMYSALPTAERSPGTTRELAVGAPSVA